VTQVLRVQPASIASERPITYRPDVDGLRAVAILSVLCFHTFPRFLPGGFVGVDVFFVISGYLISSIILSGLASDRFSLRQFYARRIRRIFPALLVVLAACLAFGWVTLLAGDYEQLGKHVAAAAGFGVNLVLWQESGYFDSAAALKPLLHLWSLGVEEQFYVFWPALLWLAWKRRVNLLALTLSIIAVSFWLGARITNANAAAVFYSPITRLWELLFGCFLALTPTYVSSFFKKPQTRGENLKAFAGLFLIAAAVFGLRGSVAYPGWRALLPTAGAFLLISAGPDAWLNRRVLSHPILIGIGLISYPLYLWHWPLLSFVRIMGLPDLPIIRIALALASIGLAWGTYSFIERPARHSRTATTVGLLLVLMVAIGSAGLYIVKRDGFDVRFPASLRPYSNYKYTPGVDARAGRCWLIAAQSFTEYADECVDRVGDGTPKPLVLI
jgi:peptidoglycan/LPS O-acetylase OafA/YrhL